MKTLNPIKIKTLAIILCTYLGGHSVSLAQGPTIGFQGGSQLTILSDDGESQSGLGYSFGITTILPMNDKWSFRSEINFQSRKINNSYEESYTGPYYSYESKGKTTLTMNYIDLPFIFQYNSGKRFGFYYGPQIGGSISSKYKETYESKYTDQNGEVEESEGEYTSSGYNESVKEISFLFGPTYTFDSGLGIDIRIQRSLGMFYNQDFITDEAWTQFRLGLKYDLPLGK